MQTLMSDGWRFVTLFENKNVATRMGSKMMEMRWKDIHMCKSGMALFPISSWSTPVNEAQGLSRVTVEAKEAITYGERSS